MLKHFFVFLFLISTLISSGQTYTPVDEGSKVKFIIKNFGINTDGTFQGLSGTVIFDPDNLSTAVFNVSVEAHTVNTNITARDNHIKKPEYLDAEKFPKLIFNSTKVTKTNTAEYLYIFGNLSIKGVTREVKFPFTAKPKDDGYLFEGEFKINRRDFGVGGRSISMSDELLVVLSVFAKKL